MPFCRRWRGSHKLILKHCRSGGSSDHSGVDSISRPSPNKLHEIQRKHDHDDDDDDDEYDEYDDDDDDDDTLFC